MTILPFSLKQFSSWYFLLLGSCCERIMNLICFAQYATIVNVRSLIKVLPNLMLSFIGFSFLYLFWHYDSAVNTKAMTRFLWCVSSCFLWLCLRSSWLMMEQTRRLQRHLNPAPARSSNEVLTHDQFSVGVLSSKISICSNKVQSCRSWPFWNRSGCIHACSVH